MRRTSLVLRIVYAVAFLVAMAINVSTAIEILPSVGWRFGGAPVLSSLYWHSLMLVDPTVSALLLIRPKVGLLAAGIIALTNFAHNLWFAHASGQSIADLDRLTLGFLVFYVATIIPAWRGAHAADAAETA